MGMWGTNFYDNDCTCDVRDTYEEFLFEQFSDEEAYKKTLEQFSEYFGTDEEPLFWCALADTQWNLGRLMPDVKDNALRCISSSGSLRFKYFGWKKILDELKRKLDKPMCPRKEIKPISDFITNPWNVGDVYAYQFHTKFAKEHNIFNKYIIFQKIFDEPSYDGMKFSRVQIFDKMFDEIPSLSDLKNVRILPLDNPNRYETASCCEDFPLCLNAIIEMDRKYANEYPKEYLTFIGNENDKHNFPFANEYASTLAWYDMEKIIYSYYDWWKDLAYDMKDGKEYVFKIKE